MKKSSGRVGYRDPVRPCLQVPRGVVTLLLYGEVLGISKDQGSTGNLKGPRESRGMFRGPKVVEGGHWGSCEVKRDVLGIPWSHPVGSMHLLMIQGI